VAISTTGQLGAPLTNSLGNLSLSFTVSAAGGIQITLNTRETRNAFNPSSFTFGSQAGNQVVSFNAIPPNPMDDPGSFVAQQYRDFLAREPDQGGLCVLDLSNYRLRLGRTLSP